MRDVPGGEVGGTQEGVDGGGCEEGNRPTGGEAERRGKQCGWRKVRLKEQMRNPGKEERTDENTGAGVNWGPKS